MRLDQNGLRIGVTARGGELEQRAVAPLPFSNLAEGAGRESAQFALERGIGKFVPIGPAANGTILAAESLAPNSVCMRVLPPLARGQHHRLIEPESPGKVTALYRLGYVAGVVVHDVIALSGSTTRTEPDPIRDAASDGCTGPSVQPEGTA